MVFIKCFSLSLGIHPNFISLFKLYANAINPKSALAEAIPFLVIIWSKPNAFLWYQTDALPMPTVFYI